MTTILVIEDQLDVRQNLDNILTLEDYTVLTAPDGEVGLQLAQEHHSDLILCDIMMPKLSGYDVLAMLRQDETLATTPFILLTAKADRHDFREGMQLGADDHLTKPFDLDELLQAITTRLEKKAQQTEETRHQLDTLRQHIPHSLPHELLTPLNGILGSTEILLNFYENLTQADINETVQDIKISGERLHRLIQNSLLLADLDLMELRPDRKTDWLDNLTETVQLPETLRTLVMARSEQDQQQDDVVFVCAPLTVKIAAPDFSKIVEEVVDNAFKFSVPGSPITVTAQDHKGQLELTIQDQGRGMTTDAIRQVGAYTQFERALYEQQGSGLGLSLAKKLTELYGGTLSITSQRGQGTTILITGWPCNSP